MKSLIGAFLCSFVHHSKSGKGFSLIFSQFYHSWLPQIWGTVVFVGYLTVGFVLDSTTYISPGRIIYMLHSSVVLEKVFLSKLPLLNCPNRENAYSQLFYLYFNISLFFTVKLLSKQLSVWPLSDAFSWSIGQQKTILISSWNRCAIQIVSWPEFTISRRGFPSG